MSRSWALGSNETENRSKVSVLVSAFSAPLADKFDKSLDSSCQGAGRQFTDPVDREGG
jgi:hypothetical protein